MAETGTEADAASEPAPNASARRRRGGRPSLRVEKRRACTVTIKLTPPEWRKLVELARKADLGVRPYMRARALHQRPSRRKVRDDKRAPAMLAVAAVLAALARDLRELAEAMEADSKAHPSATTLSRLGGQAHDAGMRLIGATSDAA